jgi:uncharacterized membrane protein YfcA
MYPPTVEGSEARQLRSGSIMLLGLIALCLYAMLSGPPGVERALVPAVPLLPANDLPALVLIVIGFCIGCYGTIVGIGGGPVIMPILFSLYGWPPRQLVATSLFVVFLNALSGCAGYARQERIDYAGGLKFATAAIPGAVIASVVHHVFDIPGFHLIFGFFLVLLGTYSLMNSGRVAALDGAQPEVVREFREVRIEDANGERFHFYSNDTLGIWLNLALGILVGFLGIGGGVLQVPLLTYLLRYPAHIAAATSHFVTLITCTAALLPNVILGDVMFAEAGWLGVGAVLGAQIGAQLARRLHSKLIMDLFTVVLFVFAARLLFA